MTLDDCDGVFERALASNSEAEFCHHINPLFDRYEIISIELDRGNIFWRARIIENQPYLDISELDHPPPNLARVGRLNDAGKPCFYISSREETALSEVGASQGQQIQVAGFRVLNEHPIRLAVIGEYANVQKNGYMHFVGRDPAQTIARLLNKLPRSEGLERIYVDRFLAHVLSDPNAAKNGYLFSRALGEFIHSRVNVDGIVYPSVKDRGGFNVAVLPDASDKSFHNVCCLVVEVGKIRKFGVTDYDVTISAERLDEDGAFIWRQDDSPDIVGIYGMSKEEFDSASEAIYDKNGLLNMIHRWHA